MTMISLIAAMSINNVIGINDRLPWRIPAELKYFKDTTMGKPMIMGRKTFDAIGRRLLPGRQTIVLTRDTNLSGDGFAVANNVQDALKVAGNVPEVMVIGGAHVYNEFLPIADRIYLSVIPEEYEGDAFFPELDDKIWHLVSKHDMDGFCVKILEKD